MVAVLGGEPAVDHQSIAGAPAPGIDVCLLVEGTYPYVPGGVSSWVHDIILGLPERRFSVVNIGSHPGAYGEPRFQLPKNVVALHRLFCQDGLPVALDGPARNELAE